METDVQVAESATLPYSRARIGTGPCSSKQEGSVSGTAGQQGTIKRPSLASTGRGGGYLASVTIRVTAAPPATARTR